MAEVTSGCTVWFGEAADAYAQGLADGRAAERERIFSQPVTQRFCMDDWVLSCAGCGAELTDSTMAHAAGCSEMRLAALIGEDGSDVR